MPPNNILLISVDEETNRLMESAILRPAGYEVKIVRDCQNAFELVKGYPPDVVILGDAFINPDGFKWLDSLVSLLPQLPVILLPSRHSEAVQLEAFRRGAADYLRPPVKSAQVIQAVQRCLERRKRLEDWALVQSRRSTKSLQKRVNSLEAFQRIGRSVTASLDLDSVLKAVVDAAVELTGAEEGSLLLLDEATGELYMRASRNFQDDFVRTFRMPVQDTLPGRVLRTGKPVMIDQPTPKKIKTSYLVYNLIYVPIQLKGQNLGVLGVDHRQGGKSFVEQHITLVSALADYAAIAIENAKLYSHKEIERNKLETILTGVGDGVIVVDDDHRLILINRTMQSALQLGEIDFTGKPVEDVIREPELLEIFKAENKKLPGRSEITLQDGRIYNALLASIPEVGMAVTLQDITHLKELDRIKSEFVSTVSHDLRSPLTAILGYAELVDRAGPMTDQQREFIRRIQFSVNNITSLINDLLDLGRIEAGFDAQKEIIQLETLTRYSVDGLLGQIDQKRLDFSLEFAGDLPGVLGNPARLQQMVVNLVGNAVKFTAPGGKITVAAHLEGGQIVFQVADNGPGIPPADQPYIFDKFYRAGNVDADVPGTGLGLAIVKSIVENHRGRIWVESSAGKGSTFTVVLPVAGEASD
ncbi:MAG: ATP-binding protein [Omnitrophica WOR_2 bacterium]